MNGSGGPVPISSSSSLPPSSQSSSRLPPISVSSTPGSHAANGYYPPPGSYPPPAAGYYPPYQPPVSSGAYGPPVSSGGYGPPVSSGPYGPPISSGAYGPPVSSGAYTAPPALYAPYSSTPYLSSSSASHVTNVSWDAVGDSREFRPGPYFIEHFLLPTHWKVKKKTVKISTTKKYFKTRYFLFKKKTDIKTSIMNCFHNFQYFFSKLGHSKTIV